MATPSVSGEPALEARVGRALTRRKLTLATAESATGGRVADRVTNVSGSSAYFLGGVIAYDNAVKSALLGVPDATLRQHGAVSPETAIAMAEGVRRLLGADVGVSTTGIAGPTGATPQKPVGLVYVAAAIESRVQVRRHVFSGNRDENKRDFAQAALDLLAEVLGA